MGIEEVLNNDEIIPNRPGLRIVLMVAVAGGKIVVGKHVTNENINKTESRLPTLSKFVTTNRAEDKTTKLHGFRTMMGTAIPGINVSNANVIINSASGFIMIILSTE